MLSPDHHGPVEYLVLEFPGEAVGPDLAPALAELTASGAVRILDLVYMHKDAAGGVRWYEADEAESPDPDVAHLLDEERCDLLSEADLASAADALAPATCGCMVVVENVWEARLEDAVRKAHGRVAADERVVRDQVAAALRYAAQALEA